MEKTSERKRRNEGDVRVERYEGGVRERKKRP